MCSMSKKSTFVKDSGCSTDLASSKRNSSAASSSRPLSAVTEEGRGKSAVAVAVAEPVKVGHCFTRNFGYLSVFKGCSIKYRVTIQLVQNLR